MRRDQIGKNFEKMEMLLIADFHLYNLIFAKEELGLNNHKAAILLNILWHLLKNKNPSYIQVEEKPEEKLRESKSPQLLNQKEDNILKNKSLKSDLELLQKLLLAHCNSSDKDFQAQQDCFTVDEIKRVVEYAHYAYIDKFKLFNYVFGFKKKNEEKKIIKTISRPTEVPPLVEALYMGHDRQPIVNEDEDEQDLVSFENNCVS